MLVMLSLLCSPASTITYNTEAPGAPYLKVQSLHSKQPIHGLHLHLTIHRLYSFLFITLKGPHYYKLVKGLILMRPLKDRHCYLTEHDHLDSVSLS